MAEFDTTSMNIPDAVHAIEAEARATGFGLSSDLLTGDLLRTLAASKPGGMLLELGTGAGMGSAWLLAGMDAHAKLLTVDRDEQVTAIARRHLGHDPRVTFQLMDGARFLESLQGQAPLFDLIFADSYPGKFLLLEETLSLLKPGGLYVIDDLLPQPTWPEHHKGKVEELLKVLARRNDIHITRLNWSTGIVLAVKG